MKLVFIIDNPRYVGGGDYAQFQFAAHLAKLGHDVTVFAANKNKFFSSLPSTAHLNVHIRHEIPRFMKGMGFLNRIWDSIYTALITRRFVKKKKPHWIIGYLNHSANKAVSLAKKSGARSANFVFEHPLWMHQQIGDEYRFDKDMNKRWNKTKRSYLVSDLLFPNSIIVRDKMEEWLNRKVEEPIYPGIEVEFDEVEREYAICYVGRLQKYKNVDVTIKALKKIENPPHFHIVGDGPKRKELEKLADSLSVACTFHGQVDNLTKGTIIRKSMFMVFGSSFEGFGMPPGEALACERPCIAADIPVLRSVYKDYLDYFPVKDIEALVKGMKKLMDDEYAKKRGVEGKYYVLGRFTWARSAKKIESVLRDA